jgi:hypothetical protein
MLTLVLAAATRHPLPFLTAATILAEADVVAQAPSHLLLFVLLMPVVVVRLMLVGALELAAGVVVVLVVVVELELVMVVVLMLVVVRMVVQQQKRNLHGDFLPTHSRRLSPALHYLG